MYGHPCNDGNIGKNERPRHAPRFFAWPTYAHLMPYLQAERKMRTRFEIALWSCCKRLPTWRDKPELQQPASRGGLKRTPPANSSSSASGGEAGHLAAEGDGGVGGKTFDEGAAGDSDAAPRTSEWEERVGPGREGARVVSARRTAADAASAAAIDGEEELREYLLMMRPAEVVEVQLEGPGAAAVRVNLAPMLAVVGLLRKVNRTRSSRQGEAPSAPCWFNWGRVGAPPRTARNRETHRSASL